MVPDKPQKVEISISHDVVILASEPDAMLRCVSSATKSKFNLYVLHD